MENDDNVLIFVVDDEECSKDDLLNKVTAKLEPLESYVLKQSDDEVFEDSAPKEAKEEPVTKVEYDEGNLEQNDQEIEDYDDVEYLEEYPVEFQTEFVTYDDDNDVDDEDYIEDKGKKRKTKISLQNKNAKGTIQKKKRTPRKGTMSKKTPAKLESFVDELREKYPDIADDEQQLVEQLTSTMRKIRPPDLPKDICEEVEVEGKMKYECTVCGVERDTRATAAIHYQYMHGEFYLQCFACGTMFRNTPHLYKHEMRCTAPDAKLVLQARGRYLGRKGRGRPFTTRDKFVTANTLPLQEPKVKGRYYCSKCPASFSHRNGLTAHENTHEGLRPYRCHHCTMAYTSHPALKRHLQLHGEYRFVCDHCGRRFQLRPALIAHLDSHRPVRKYPCSHCERRFTQKTSLRHHMNKVHFQLPAAHGCLICPKRYARLGHVKEHMSRAHGLCLITRNMFKTAMPSMTDNEIDQAKKLFNLDGNLKPMKEIEPGDAVVLSQDDEYVLPDLNTDYIVMPKKKSRKDKVVSIIQKKKPKISQNVDPKETERRTPIIVRPSAKRKLITAIDTNNRIMRSAKRSDATPEDIEDNKCPKPKKKRPPRKIIVETEPPVKIDEEIDERICNIEYKRQKKAPINTADVAKTDDDLHKIVRDIKSTLTSPKVETARTKKRKSMNFYELKHEFLENLKKEIEIPQPKPMTVEVECEEFVPGTEIPEMLAPNNTDNYSPQKDDKNLDEKWKEASEKNKVLADFIEYVNLDVVPKHVPILRRGGQTKRKK